MGIINQAYKVDKGRCSGPVFFTGETYAIYVNLDEPTTDTGFANFRLDLRLSGNPFPVVQGIGQMTQDFVNGIFYNIMLDFAIPADLPFGNYQLAIYDPTTNITKALSNNLIVENRQYVPNAARLTFRNDVNIYGINYEGNPEYYQSLTLNIIQVGFDIQNELKQYRNVSNRRLRNWKSYKDEIATIESYYFSEDMHKAISAIYDHNEIYLDHSFVTPKIAYKVDDRQNSVLSKGSIDVVIDDSVSNPKDELVVSYAEVVAIVQDNYYINYV